MESEYLKGVAKVVWDESIANVYSSRAKELLGVNNTGTPESCESCDTIWVPGITCKLRTVTNHNQNKKLRIKKQNKLARYLAECQKYREFEVRREIKVEYRCQCSHTFIHTTLLPKPKPINTSAPKTQSKSQAARERSKKRRNNTVDNQANLMASLSKPSLSLGDFLM